MSEQRPSHEVEGIVRRAPRQDCVKSQILGRVPKMYAAFKVPKNTVASIILKWKKFETTKTRAVFPAKLSNQGRRALIREVTLTELQSSSMEMGEPFRRITISATLHQSALYCRVARWKPLLRCFGCFLRVVVL